MPKDIKKYVTRVKLDLKALEGFRPISMLSKVKQVLTGLKPDSVQQIIFRKYPNILSAGTVLEGEGGVYDIIKITQRKLTKFNNLSLDG